MFAHVSKIGHRVAPLVFFVDDDPDEVDELLDVSKYKPSNDSTFSSLTRGADFAR